MRYDMMGSMNKAAHHEYSVSAEGGVLYHAEVSYSPIFRGSEADAAVASLFSQSFETK